MNRGLLAMICSCGLFSISGVFFHYAQVYDPRSSSLVLGIVRVVINGGIPLAVLWSKGQTKTIFAGRWELWAWGFCGAMTLMTFYFAMEKLGVGRASFLNSAAGVFIVAFSPWVARQESSPAFLWASLGCLLGVYLIKAGADLGEGFAVWVGFSSAIFTALAYLIIARVRQATTASVLMIYWAAFGCLGHLLFFAIKGIGFPEGKMAWMFIVFSGLTAACSQYLTAISYQTAPAAAAASLSYLTPVLSLGLDVLLFQFELTAWAGMGVAIILFCGVTVPFYSQNYFKIRGWNRLTAEP